MDANKFGFQPNLSNMETYLKENTNDNTSDGPVWWNIPAGMSSVRILPPWDPTGRVALPVYFHPIEFQGKGMKYKKYNWTCVNKTFGKPCNICEGLAKIAAAGVNTSDYEPTRRQFYLNAIVMFDPIYDRDSRMGKKPEDCDGVAPGTHVLLKAPKTIYDWIVSNITNPMVGDITSITNGIDIYITKEGSGLGTTYTATLCPDGRKPIPEDILKKVDNLYDLDSIFSTGFDDEQVGELVASLARSSNVMVSGIGAVSAQMGGYTQQAPNTVSAMPNSVLNPANVQPTMSNPAFGASNPPAFGAPQFGAATNDIPWTNQAPQQQVPTPVAPSVASSDQPECFGNYNPGNVKCVTCPSELICQKYSSSK